MTDWRNDGDILADLQAALEQLEQQSREPLVPFEPDEQLRQLAEAFARRHGFSPAHWPRPARERALPPVLQFAIAAGILSPDHARDLDAFGDGIASRLGSGELTPAQASALTEATAIRDGEAVMRARNRHERRAEAAQRRARTARRGQP